MNQRQVELKEVRKFGIILGIILLAIGSIHFLKGHSRVFSWLLAFSALSFIMGVFLTRWFIPVYTLFTKLTRGIGFFNTRLLLSIVFYIVLTPTGLLMRLFGKDCLDRKIEKDKDSYWIKREDPEEDIASYEKQF